MEQMTGDQEIRFLDRTGGDTARLAELAYEMGVLARNADPELAQWESCLLLLRSTLIGTRVKADVDCPACGERNALIFSVDDLPRAVTPMHEVIDGVRLRSLRLSDLLDLESSDSDRLTAALVRAADRDETWASDILASEKADQAVQAFVHGEFVANARRLLDEVHLLATTYHWSEDTILSLPRARRQAYLERIERDSLRTAIGQVGP